VSQCRVSRSVGDGLRVAVARVLSLRSLLVILTFFSSQGWQSWDVERRPLIPERMPILVDDDLRFEDSPSAVRASVAVNRWLRELPASGAPSPNSWAYYARVLKEWMEFLAEHGVGLFAGREVLVQPTHADGVIRFTASAELALQLFGAAQIIQQAGQRCEVLEPERASTGRGHDEHVRLGRVGPAHRKRILAAVLIKEEHPVLRPGLPDGQQHELAAVPRMERMRHPDTPLTIIGIRSS
jgi:hypothetical protein